MSTLEGKIELQTAPAAPVEHSPSAAQIASEPNSVSTSAVESHVRMIVVIGLIAIAAGCVVVKVLNPFAGMDGEAHGNLVRYLLVRLQRIVDGWSLTAMLIYPLAVLGIFILERLLPAVPDQKPLGTGVIQDAMWVLIAAAAGAMLFGWYTRFLYRLYEHYLSFLTITTLASLPMIVRFVLAVLVLDLTRWGQHWLHHNVKWLWPFHAVHHSQQELNLFSDYKIHFMEYFVRLPISVLPMMMLGLEQPQILGWLMISAWHARLYHANIRTDFGPLRYLLVTPQSHRVHHSRDPRHFNQNYGAMLSVWDYLFGTQHREYDVYPDTGIPDDQFPAPGSRSLGEVLLTPIRQLVYPFRQIWGFCFTGWRAAKVDELP